jgi:hypothetical protein
VKTKKSSKKPMQLQMIFPDKASVVKSMKRVKKGKKK